MKTYGRHGRYRTVDLYRVKVALSHLSYVPTKNPFIDNKLYLVCQGGKVFDVTTQVCIFDFQEG
jgi:hypothetical protein